MGTLAPSAISEFLISTKLPTLVLWAEVGTRPQPGEGADLCLRSDMSLDEMAEATDGRAVLDDDAWADDDVRLDQHILADPGVMAEEHGLRRDKRRALRHDLAAQTLLHRCFGRASSARELTPSTLGGRAHMRESSHGLASATASVR